MVDETNDRAEAAADAAAPPAPRRRKGLILTGIVVGGVLVLGATFGGGVAVGTALDLVHFGPEAQQGQQAHGYFGGQRPGSGQNGNGNSGSTGQGNGGQNG